MTRTLYLFGSAAPPLFDIAWVAEAAQARGWDVCLGLTPAAAEWVAGSVDGLSALTGHPVRSRHRRPGEPDVWPEPDAILFAPATFNTVNALALGLTDRFVVGVAAEAIGKGVPMAVMPCVNTALARHPQFDQSLATLHNAGVRTLFGEHGFAPNAPGEDVVEGFPWETALAAADALVSTPHV
ncbi:flavoprotein [Streptomyces sp. NRRL S-87]|uniref:flavoprotein n=1 Tax=Streptomyces sp. NRRL S-87 TaxID=1463920 RepID=UPI00056869D7|nr:flavoprotein [Streptomyces sp. NRRL S-87]